MKTCSTCKQLKPKDEFYKDKRTLDGLKCQCKRCHTQGNLRTRDINKKRDANRNYMRRARLKDPEKIRARERASSINRQRDYKSEARYHLNLAVKRGVITKPNYCEACGQKNKVTAHHDDYTKSLEVRWLCYECHGKLHRKII